MYFSFVGFVFLPLYLSTTAGCPVRNWYFSPSIKTILNLCLASRCFDSEYFGWYFGEYILKDFFDENINLKNFKICIKKIALSFWRTIFLRRMQSWVGIKIQNASQALLNRLKFNMIIEFEKINNRIIQKLPKLVCHKTNFVSEWFLKMRRKYFYLFLLHFKLYSVVTVNRTHRDSETVSLQSEIFYFAKYFAHAKKFAQNAAALNLEII